MFYFILKLGFQVCIARPALIGELFTTETWKACTALSNHESPQQWIDLNQFNSAKHLPGTYYVPRSVEALGKQRGMKHKLCCQEPHSYYSDCDSMDEVL